MGALGRQAIGEKHLMLNAAPSRASRYCLGQAWVLLFKDVSIFSHDSHIRPTLAQSLSLPGSSCTLGALYLGIPIIEVRPFFISVLEDSSHPPTQRCHLGSNLSEHAKRPLNDALIPQLRVHAYTDPCLC